MPAAQPPGAPLPPGSVIGMLGGGQLGRMAALAAAQLGYRCHVYCPEADAPGTQVTARATIAAYDDAKALAGFAEAVDLVSYEFENIPLETVEVLAARVPVRPGPEVLRICRNRLREKDFCRSIGVPTTASRAVATLADLTTAAVELGRPCVLKTAELGYDGKGQALIEPQTDLAALWAEMGPAAPTAGLILEGFVDFRLEVSVIVARSRDGGLATYVPVENRHDDHILDQTLVPAQLTPAVAARAEEIARRLAEALDLVGLLAVELFVTRDERLLVNELAPRPHNSGHWTLDACVTSQFEQFIRAIAGLPLGATERHCDAVMQNLIGDEVAAAQAALQDPRAKLHLYGKAKVRPGRKMGHITRLLPRS